MLFFFFQAEDGIRDLTVTGVQTCALPILRHSVARKLPPAWVDFRARLKRGARRFREIDRKTRGYFGWPAMARAKTATKVMKLRGKLIAAEVMRALGPRRPRPRKRPAR